jgi:NADH dehydrogenase
MAETERSRRRVARAIEAVAGGLAGLVAGLAMATILSAQGRIDPNPLGLGMETIGLGTHLGLAVVAGCLYGTIYRYQPGGLAAAIGAGLVFGLGWWIVVHLTLVPLVAATGPGWSLAESVALFPRLVSGVLVAGLTAILFQAIATRLARDIEPVAIVASSVPVRQRIVILGGGFGGTAAAQRLEQRFAHRPEVEVTLVSRSNFLLFTPMLAEVASSSLTARHISAPIRAACPRTRFRRADVESIDPTVRTVTIRDREDGPPEQLPYDQLILALGAVPGFHGLPGVADHARTLKTLDDAVGLRDHCIRMLERAEAQPAGPERDRLLMFVVAGGGFAGAELIAELGDLVRSALVYYPRIAPEEPRFVLVHSRERILPELSESLAAYARERMERRALSSVSASDWRRPRPAPWPWPTAPSSGHGRSSGPPATNRTRSWRPSTRRETGPGR